MNTLNNSAKAPFNLFASFAQSFLLTHKHLSFLLILIGAMIISSTCFADNYPVKSGKWQDPTVWIQGHVPTGSEVAVITAGKTISLDSGSTTNAICLDVYANAGGTLTVAGGYTLTVNEWIDGSFGGTITFNTGSTLIMAATSGSPHIYGGTIVSFPNLTFTGGSNFINTAITVAGNFTINSGATVSGSIVSMNIGGNWVNNGTYVNNSGILNFNGSSSQSISGSSATTLYSLTVNSASGLTLSSPVTVSTVVNLTNGILTTSVANLLTLSSTASVTNASNSSFVDGPIKKIGNSAFVFPVGKTGTGYQPIGISAPGTVTDAFTAEYIRTDPYTLGTQIDVALTKISSCEYWQLDRTTGSPTVDVTLYGNTNSGCAASTGANYFTGGGSLLSALRVAHYNAGNDTWENYGGSASGTSPNITITATAVSSFSPFSFGSAGSNPLPVKLISFTAKSEATNSVLNWSTATEINNDHFAIERSTDGVNFNTIGEVKGAGNSMNIKNYTYTDFNASTDGNSLFYYRLKQVDFNGKFEYSYVASVNFAKANTVTILTIQPNPFAEQLSVNYELPATGNITISIIDAQGHTLAKNETSAKKGSNTMQFNTADYAKGLYFINVTFNGTSNSYKMIVKN